MSKNLWPGTNNKTNVLETRYQFSSLVFQNLLIAIVLLITKSGFFYKMVKKWFYYEYLYKYSCSRYLFLTLNFHTLHFSMDGYKMSMTCTVVNWGIVTDLWQLYYYFRSGKREYNNYFLAFTVVIQLPQMSYYDPFNNCAGPIWVQIQNPWSKRGLWWSSEIPNFKNKKSVQQCGFQKIWKILLTLARKELLCPSNWGAQVSLKISSNE